MKGSNKAWGIQRQAWGTARVPPIGTDLQFFCFLRRGSESLQAQVTGWWPAQSEAVFSTSPKLLLKYIPMVSTQGAGIQPSPLPPSILPPPWASLISLTFLSQSLSIPPFSLLSPWASKWPHFVRQGILKWIRPATWSHWWNTLEFPASPCSQGP